MIRSIGNIECFCTCSAITFIPLSLYSQIIIFPKKRSEIIAIDDAICKICCDIYKHMIYCSWNTIFEYDKWQIVS